MIQSHVAYVFRTSKVIEVIDLPVPGAIGIAFGGIRRNILYVITSSIILDTLSSNVDKEVSAGTSIYAIYGLHSKGVPSTRMKVK